MSRRISASGKERRSDRAAASVELRRSDDGEVVPRTPFRQGRGEALGEGQERFVPGARESDEARRLRLVR